MRGLPSFLTAVSLLAFEGVTAQYNNLYTTNLSAFWNATTYLQAQATNVTKLLNQGYAMALQYQSPILHHQFIHRCIWADIYNGVFDGTESPGFLDPTEFSMASTSSARTGYPHGQSTPAQALFSSTRSTTPRRRKAFSSRVSNTLASQAMKLPP